MSQTEEDRATQPEQVNERPDETPGTNEETPNRNEKSAVARVLHRFAAHPSAEVVEFPASLSSLERRTAHTVAEELGLQHGSVGIGAFRRIRAAKPGYTGPEAISESPEAKHEIAPHIVAQFLQTFKLPIPVYTQPELDYHLDLTEPYCNSRTLFGLFQTELQARLSRPGSSPGDFFRSFHATRERIVKAVKATAAYRSFLSADLTRYRVRDQRVKNVSANLSALYTEANADHFFLSVDMRAANFASLRLHDPELVFGARTYDDLVARFSTSLLFPKCKFERQLVFSDLSGDRQRTIYSWWTAHVCAEIAERHTRLFPAFLSFDEFIIPTTAESWPEDFASVQRVIAEQFPDLVDTLRVQAFQLLQIGRHPFFAKEVVRHSGRPADTPPSYELKCVTHGLYAQCIKILTGRPLEPADLFYNLDGLLVRFCHPLARDSPVAQLPRTGGLRTSVLQRFVTDFHLPIPSITSPQFERLLDLYEPLFGSRTLFEQYSSLLTAVPGNSDEQIHANFEKAAETVRRKITETPLFAEKVTLQQLKAFLWLPHAPVAGPGPKYAEHRARWLAFANHGLSFVTISLPQAPFHVLRLLAADVVSGCSTYEEFVAFVLGAENAILAAHPTIVANLTQRMALGPMRRHTDRLTAHLFQNIQKTAAERFGLLPTDVFSLADTELVFRTTIPASSFRSLLAEMVPIPVPFSVEQFELRCLGLSPYFVRHPLEGGKPRFENIPHDLLFACCYKYYSGAELEDTDFEGCVDQRFTVRAEERPAFQPSVGIAATDLI